MTTSQMKIKPDKIKTIITEIDEIIKEILVSELEHAHKIEAVHSSFRRVCDVK